MDNRSKQLTHLFIRYVIILLAGLGNLFIFYKTLTPLTIRAVALILSIFTKVSISGNMILSQKVIIEIIPACVAGSAYYLLLILVLSVPKIKTLKRIKILAFTFITLFILNTARILLLAAISSTTYFQSAHIIFWYFISIIFVVGIWIAVVKIYKIKP